MCGIVGALASKRNAVPDLFEMLSQVEYRGYDSAGISTVDEIGLTLRKSKGMLDILRKKVDESPISGEVGIGHTRWATHGEPSDKNAHPHSSKSGGVSIVHNGIIENYAAIKEELSGEGVHFFSETDSEVIAAYTQKLLNENAELEPERLVSQLTSKLEGAYAILVLLPGSGGKIIAIRQACPLNFVVTERGTFISSDISSLSIYGRKISILEDGQAAVFVGSSASVIDFQGHPSNPTTIEVDWDTSKARKEGFDTFLRKEIQEEPGALGSLVAAVTSQVHDFRRLLDQIDPDSVLFLACGSASYSCQFARSLSRWMRVPVHVDADIGSEFRYNPSLISERTLVVAVSQSGETADTLQSVKLARDSGAKVVSFINVVGSSLERMSDFVFRLSAGPEIAVPSSKAVVNQFAATNFVVSMLVESGLKGHEDWKNGANLAVDAISRILEMEGDFQKVAEKVSGFQSSFALGRGLDFPTALEMALKLKETAYMHCEPMFAGEFKHGSISLVERGMPVFAFLGDERVVQKSISNMSEVKARGARLFVFDAVGVDKNTLADLGDFIQLPKLPAQFASLVQLAAVHLTSYHCGILRNVSVDRPRNLAKSVTVE